ncbi:MAG: ATP-binding protein [Spirochaetaceae bacterium]|nr:ATP-binding protein [Spirochaetaceae bacterium]
MTAKMGIARTKGKGNKKIYLRIFIVIIIVASVINVCGLTVGAVFLTRSISHAIENDMLVAIDIADLYVTKEIELLKIKAAEAARDIRLFFEAGEREGILDRVCAKYLMYKGLGVFSETTLLDFCGQFSVSQDLLHEPFMQIAFAGGQAVSTTMYSLENDLVMYVSAPIKDGLVLAAVLPGLYLSNKVSQLKFWQSGHLFIDDAEGVVISNIREDWVLQRRNFIELAKTDNRYEWVSAMVKRGIAGERGTARFSVDGVPRICAFRPISSPTEEWFVGIIAPLNESVLSDIPGSILLMGIITFILSIIAATGAAIILKRPYEEADNLRRDAEIASISKTTFLANMSHEIRTPMNSIIGFSDLAMDGETSPKTRDYLDKIHTNAEWLLHIINDILDISKIESGKMELENIPFDLHKLFSSCRTLIMPKAIEKGIILHFYAEPSIGRMPVGDPTRLRQVLINLLTNAVKFTNTGMVKLHTAIKNISRKNITMYFEVKDSGIGMTPEQIKKVFKPFAQAEAGITRKYGGTGLGLSISKNIVEMMGGTLSVESTSGIGSKFSFELTFDTIDVADDEMFEKKVALNVLEKPTFEGEILLFEDNVMNQQVICEHLSRVGLKTIVAENGKIGVEIVKNRIANNEKLFDLIFMDIHMPVMDGLEASNRIFELNTGIPIVAITANIMSEDMKIYKQSGMSDCMGKPFTSQELWHCLMKYFTPVFHEPGDKHTQVEADVELQRSLQLLFIKSNKERFHEIIKALEAGDIKLAHRLAHSLKGNAGQLGKIILQQAASDVESRLKSGENKVTKEQLQTLETELNAVLTEFSTLLDGCREEPEFQSYPDKQLLDEESAQKLIEELEPILKMGNPDCGKFIDGLRLIPYDDDLKIKLIQQIEDFDFGPACITLAELKEKSKLC